MYYPIIDAHQHFWKYSPQRDGWMTADMKKLQRDWLPVDIENIYKENNVIGSVILK